MSHGANDLDKLAQERENILLAVIGAFLHNLGKLSHAFLAYQRCQACKNAQPTLTPASQDQAYQNFNYQAVAGLVAEFMTDPGTPSLRREEWRRLEPNAASWLEENTNNILPEDFRRWLQKRNISLPTPLDDRQYGIGDFIEFQHYGRWYKPKASGKGIDIVFPGGSKATELLEISHDAASGVEKEGSKTIHGLQPHKPTYLSTAFGYEIVIDEAKIETLRQSLLDDLLNKKQNFVLYDTRNQLVLGLGDTRRTINDVTLWDISSSVAGFYKAAVARLVIDNAWIPRGSFTWRLLRVAYDGLAFLERAATVGDLLGRQTALQDALDRVRHLLEYHYPLGNEVYRDEHGSAFVVPALDGDNPNGDMLHGLLDTLILKEFRDSKLNGEVEPQISISPADQKAAKLHEELQKPLLPLHAFTDAMQCWWQGEPDDICTACGVRPQGWGAPSPYYRKKAQERNVCYVCLERRSNRAEVWAKGYDDDACTEQREAWQHTIWMDEVADSNGRLALVVGRFELEQWLSGEMIQSMLVVCDTSNNTYESKNASFARIQRVWRTTQQFWDSVWKEDIPAGIGEQHPRILIDVGGNLDLGFYHAYDTEVDGKRLSVVWDKEKQSLIIADNLHAWDGAEHLKQRLEQMQREGKQLPLSEPGGYGQQRKTATSATIGKVSLRSSAYTPAVKLLDEPRSFLALVPATHALEVANKIRERYEREMSKVRNRLPLFLGLVFFGRRQPLFSALDAGRRMLGVPLAPEECSVQSNSGHGDLERNPRQPHFKQWYDVRLTTQQGEVLKWRVSTVMGDGKTEDDWYPYIHVKTDAQGNPVSGRKQFSHPEHSDQQWVHISDVQQEDTICFTPARFAYIHLDTSARRFEVGTEETLLPLEELERISALWESVKQLDGMSESKLHAVVSLLNMKRDEWGEDNPAYEQLIRTVFSNEHMDSLLIDGEEKDIANRLLRTFEIYQQILKKRLPKRETAEENSQ